MLNPILFIESSLANYKERLAEAKAAEKKDCNKISFLNQQLYSLKLSLQKYYN